MPAYTHDTILRIGKKYKGQKLGDIPHSYLVWLYDKGAAGDLKTYIEENVPLIQAQIRASQRERKQSGDFK